MLFLRYGYARTTMADVAKAAGLSRPALYLVFPDKEGIFSAVVEWANERSLKAIREGLTLLAVSPLLEGIGGRYFEDCAEAEPATGVPFRGFKEYALDPDAADRPSGTSRCACSRTRASYRRHGLGWIETCKPAAA